jgi:2-polyprenyl-3-methyl-5-hydroxy-6-metoxy-1,4-benzoquinol methylase
MSSDSMYSDKKDDYYELVREDIIALVPGSQNRILEIGCGRGNTLLRLKQLDKATEIVGVDIKKYETGLDKFICGDIEQLELSYPENHFDVIIAADVLEHLIDPWSALKKLTSHLKPGGTFIASIPNVRELKTLYNIMIKGTFEYAEFGILDRTHLRFFCKRNIIDLINDAGLKIDAIHHNFTKKRSRLNLLTLGFLKDFLIVQYLVKAKKS